MAAGRRDFVRRTIQGVIGLTVVGSAPLAAHAISGDEHWLRIIGARKHRMFIDVPRFFFDSTPFRRTRTLLDVMRDSYGVEDREIGIAVGFHGDGLAHLMSAAAWADLSLVRWLAPRLADAESDALKSGTEAFAAANAANINELCSRGAHFLACRQTIGRWAQRLATENGKTVQAATDGIIRGLHEHVERVPAMIVATLQAQERGAKYVSLA